MKIKITIITVLFFLCGKTIAQYDEQVNFRSIEEFLSYRILFDDVFKANEEILRGIVKKIKITDENGVVVTEISVDESGKITDYKWPQKYGQDIIISYDIKNNLSGLRINRLGENKFEDVKLSYVGNTLLSYEKYINGKEPEDAITMRYDFPSDKSRITGFESNFWRGDSIPFSMNFKYDEQARLYDVRVTGDNIPYYTIEYSGDTVKINRGDMSSYESFVIRENKFVHHKIHSEELSFTGERDFEYDERGLVSREIYYDNRGSKYFFKYEYDYYH